MFNLFKKKNTRNFQEEFDNLMSKVVFPILKENGFKKKGNNFIREITDITQAFNVQKSQWNSKENISFTFNIGFYNEKIFKDTEIHEIPDFPKTYDCFIQMRTGHLVYGNDKWFDINQNSNIPDLEKEIEKVINETISLFNKHTTLISLKDIENGFMGGVFSLAKAAFFIEINEKQEAEKILKELHKDSLVLRPNIMTTKYPDGSEEETVFPISGNGMFIQRLKDLAEKYNLELE